MVTGRDDAALAFWSGDESGKGSGDMVCPEFDDAVWVKMSGDLLFAIFRLLTYDLEDGFAREATGGAEADEMDDGASAD